MPGEEFNRGDHKQYVITAPPTTTLCLIKAKSGRGKERVAPMICIEWSALEYTMSSGTLNSLLTTHISSPKPSHALWLKFVGFLVEYRLQNVMWIECVWGHLHRTIAIHATRKWNKLWLTSRKLWYTFHGIAIGALTLNTHGTCTVLRAWRQHCIPLNLNLLLCKTRNKWPSCYSCLSMYKVMVSYLFNRNNDGDNDFYNRRCFRRVAQEMMVGDVAEKTLLR